ncbi:MAG: DUF3488 and transglutaminase-like domain-containing protein [Acidobacteriota bacterium]
MHIDKFFNAISYSAVFFGFLSLWISGTLGLASGGLFVAGLLLAWNIEGTRWQITERPGTALIVLAIPLYFAAWKFGIFEFASTTAALPGFLARLILTLSAIKLLQYKSDRDWVFLYLMGFFQVLLAAGLVISALYLGVFVAYIFVMVCAVILLEMRRTRNKVVAGSSSMRTTEEQDTNRLVAVRRIPLTAFGLITLITVLAAPMFFLLPRVGAAGGGGTGQNGVSTFAGFSESVRLGRIGLIQAGDEVVMRVRLESPRIEPSEIRWRGVALDTFDNLSWSKSNNGVETRLKGDRDMIQVDFATGRDSLVIQTFYIEPLDSPVLFGMPRPVGVQGGFSVIYRDRFGSLSFQRPFERTSYRVISDFGNPLLSELRADRDKYSPDDSNYLEIPANIDPRIAKLTASVVDGTSNRYDAAAAVEKYLQNNFGYTLEQKSGGDQPLADFLFNVKEGHCEYFSTAMAVMLRTQGIATRVVNGFQRGEYNETADVYVVRQKNAHSWVEVYFPGEKSWVTFDATPFAGRESNAGAVGITGRVNHYMQALEAFWIEYFVSFDNQEQRSLYSSVKRGFTDFHRNATTYFEAAQAKVLQWWTEARGDNGVKNSILAVAKAVGTFALLGAIGLVFVWLYRKVVKSKVWLRLRDRLFARRRASVVEFYERMQRALESRGFIREMHQTPLEFAYAVSMPEAVRVTEKYNGIRFGHKDLTISEADEIEGWLSEIERRNVVE